MASVLRGSIQIRLLSYVSLLQNEETGVRYGDETYVTGHILNNISKHALL